MLTPPLEEYDREGVFYAQRPLFTMPPQTEHKSLEHWVRSNKGP
jgi:hypothetical protein